MSKENEKQQITKFCVYCGTTIEGNTTYCPNPKCGKLVLDIKPSEESLKKQTMKPETHKKVTLSRKCSGCGSLITSSVLEQCPICDTKLEKIPGQTGIQQDKKSQGKTGYIFKNKKLVLEQKFILKRNEWNFKEGLSVFANALIAYVTLRLIITMLLSLTSESTGLIEINITTIILSQLPEIVFGAYPLYYIISKKHQFQKLGLSSNHTYLITAIIIGVSGCIGLLFIDNLISVIITLMYNSGIDFIDIGVLLEEEILVLQNTDFTFILLLITLSSISAISIELAFRGVLHNTFKARFNNDFLGNATTVLLVALIYSALFLFLTFPIGIYYFFPYFMVFVFLGVIYQLNNNLLGTIIASVAYNIISIILIVYF